MQTDLKGKTVLITGGATGIGRAAALAFAKEGSRVAIVDIAKAELESLCSEIKILGGQATYGIGDLSTGEGVKTGVTSALGGNVDGVDVLVNNVGSGFVRTFDQLTDEDWDKTLQLNFMSYVRTTRLVLPGMRARGAGVIVNNASDLARQPEPVPTDYSVSKAAVLALTKGLARSEGPNIRVNAVAPGPVWNSVLVEARRLRRHVCRLPQTAPQGGGRARTVIATDAAETPWRPRRGRKRHRLPGLEPGVVCNLVCVGR